MNAKDPNTVFLVEFVGGFFGLLGLGHFLVGRTNDGLLRLVLWIVALSVGWFVTVLLMAVIIGFCMVPVMLIAQIGVPFWSANELKKQMMRGMSM